MVSNYITELDNSLLFVSSFAFLECRARLNQVLFLFQAGLFSAISTAFIIQIIPALQPNATDLTNALLVRILEQNKSFGGVDPLTPLSSVPASAVQAQSILLASLSLTLFVAFVAVLGKQWIMYYTRATSWGNIADRGKERQTKLVGLQKWRLHLVMELLPVVLQLALLLFAVGVVVYLWDLNAPVADVVLVVTSIGFTFYSCIAALGTIYRDCPFQTPLSIQLQHLALWMEELTALARVWLIQKATVLRPKFEDSFLKGPLERMFRILTSGADTQNHTDEDATDNNHPMTLSNPAFWRDDPLFAYRAREDVAASAGFWLLENSTSSSAASAVATVFSELQWPSYHTSTTALIRLRDVYVECFQAPEFKEPTRLKALQSAAAYYVLYHTQLIWNASNRPRCGVGKLPPNLPPDLVLHLHSDKWGGDDVFEHLLRIKDRSEPLMSGRFLAYIAPYWFCGDSASAIRFRPSRLQTLYELIKVLEESQMLNPTTLTDCILCVGVAMDFPLHPEDLIRIDKRCVPFPYLLALGLIKGSDNFVQTFKTVVEHIHGLALTRGRRLHYAKSALEILVTLAKKATLPLVDAVWVRGLLKRATRGGMGDDVFTVFLRLNARRDEDSAMMGVEIPPAQDHNLTQEGEADPEYSFFIKVMQNVHACSGQVCDWQDEAMYGGLIAMRDIPLLGTFPPDNDSLETLSKAMEKSKPFRVRKAAYDIVMVAREEWLRSTVSFKAFEDLDFPRKLHDIVAETGRPDEQRSFLMMIEILSEDRYWHPYLRGAMDVWLYFRREGPQEVLRILTHIGGLPLPEYNGSNPPLDEFLERLVEREWAGVPGRPVGDLTADRLEPLVEVTMQFKELLFTESGRRAVLAAVEQVIPSLGRQRGGEELGEDIRGIVDVLLEILRAGAHGANQP